MNATIIEKKEVAKGTLLVKFQVKEEFSFIPGQYFFVTIPHLAYPDERGNRRHFSIVNTPAEKGILTMTTRIRETGFKKTLAELPIGSEVELGPIGGTFTLPEDTKTPLIFIAGGIGITPFMSMLTHVGENKLEYDITLYYSNRDKQSTVFFDELEKLSSQNTHIKVEFVMTQDPMWTGKTGHIDSQFIKDNVSDYMKKTFYVVVPPAMSDAITASLKEAGVEEKQIEQENFSGY